MKYFIIVFVFIVVFFASKFFINGWHYETTKGEHTGFVTAVERNGVFFKTGTAYVKTDLSSSQEDKYCVADSAVYNKLVELSKNHSRAVLQYVSWMRSGVRYCENEEAVIIDAVAL